MSIVKIKVHKWPKDNPPIKLIFLDGHYICRCGDMIAVSERMACYPDKHVMHIPPGIWSIDEVLKIPPELTFDCYEDLGQ